MCADFKNPVIHVTSFTTKAEFKLWGDPRPYSNGTEFMDRIKSKYAGNEILIRKNVSQTGVVQVSIQISRLN